MVAPPASASSPEEPAAAKSSPRKWRIAGAVAVASSLCFLCTLLIVPRGLTEEFDAMVLRALRRLDDPRLPLGGQVVADVARDLTSLGGTSVLVLVVVLVASYLAADGRIRDAVAVLVTAVGAVLGIVVLKLCFARERPDVVPHLTIATSASFPSGHSMLAAVIYPTLGALLARFARRRRLEVIPIAAAVGITVIVGLSRIVLGVHHPTDVLAGWFAGAAFASGAWLVVDQLAKRGKVEGKAPA